MHRAAYVVTFDADGQHLVADALALVARARQTGVDVVLGSRFAGTAEGIPGSRAATLRAGVTFTRWTSGLDLTDTHNGLRVLSRRALTQIRLELPRMAHASELLNQVARAGLSYAEVPTTVVYTDYSRSKGQSQVNALNIVFDLAVRRLRATS